MSDVRGVLNVMRGEWQTGTVLAFFCPGCQDVHQVRLQDTTRPGGWTFNGDYERPTFTPSIAVDWYEGPERVHQVCHSHVSDGHIQFLGDCTHALVGQTVPIGPWPDL